VRNRSEYSIFRGQIEHATQQGKLAIYRPVRCAVRLALGDEFANTTGRDRQGAVPSEKNIEMGYPTDIGLAILAGPEPLASVCATVGIKSIAHLFEPQATRSRIDECICIDFGATLQKKAFESTRSSHVARHEPPRACGADSQGLRLCSFFTPSLAPKIRSAKCFG
jgi:hypothetical protein